MQPQEMVMERDECAHVALSETIAPYAEGHPKGGASGQDLHEETSLRACILCITLRDTTRYGG